MRLPMQTEPVQRSLATQSAVQAGDHNNSAECESGVVPSIVAGDDWTQMLRFPFGTTLPFNMPLLPV